MSENETSSAPISSAEGSPAKTSATPDAEPESSRASLARDSGDSLSESFASYDPVSCSWKTSQHSLFGGLTLYAQTWPRSGMMRSGIAFRRPTLVPLTGGIASGLWATPVANRSIGCSMEAATREADRLRPQNRWTLMTQIADQLRAAADPIWRTPHANIWKNASTVEERTEGGHTLNLQDQVRAEPRKMWPTPTSRDWKDTPGMAETGADGRDRLDQLARVVYHEERKNWPSPRASDAEKVPSGHRGNEDSLNASVARAENLAVAATGKLNPTWVEWLMGFPLGWTDLEPSETQSSRKSPNGSGGES